MERGDLKAIFRLDVQELVKNHPDRAKYGYLQGEDFQPHEWVYDAMELAYRIGLKNADFKGCF